MLRICDVDVMSQHEKVLEAFRNDQSGVVLESTFVKKTFPVLEERTGRKYPYEVKLPRSVPEMLQGDFSPSRIITVEKPIKGPFSNIWFGDATEGVQLLCGYKNGDSRYVSDVVLGDADIHGVMAGATGQGKSVTLNAIIYGICMCYAPWEVNLTLSDAKIVEFKTIATSHPMPHIKVVAATEDVSYLLSVLDQKVKEMTELNSVFSKATEVYGVEVKKIADFRKVTGLTLPQNILIFDEFQTMFSKAKKLVPKVVYSIDAVARLGRNAGYHLFLTSQELGTDLPQATLNNIKVRAAMGCSPQVSEMLLGNDGAAENFGKKGRLIFNLNSNRKRKEDNSLVIVPYIADNTASEISDALIEKGREFDVTPVLQFYDEQRVMYEDEYKEYVSGRNAGWSKIYLGEPSFVTEDEEQCVKIEMDGLDIENICVVAPASKNQRRYFSMLKYNLLRDKSTVHFVMVCNPIFEQPDFGAADLSGQFVFAENDYENSELMKIVSNTLYKRILCLRADKMVFAHPQTTESIDSIFYSIVDKGSRYDTVIFRSRFLYAVRLMQEDKMIVEGLKLNKDNMNNYLRQLIPMYEKCNSIETKLTLDKMSPVFVWMLGTDRLLGIGRDTKSKFVSAFKKLLQDCQQANMRFLVFTQLFGEITDLKDTFKWYVLDGVSAGEQSKIKCSDDYPDQISKVLGVLYTTSGDGRGCVKFKKMFLDGEIAI